MGGIYPGGAGGGIELCSLRREHVESVGCGFVGDKGTDNGIVNKECSFVVLVFVRISDYRQLFMGVKSSETGYGSLLVSTIMPLNQDVLEEQDQLWKFVSACLRAHGRTTHRKS